MHISTVIQNLGYSENEAKVYLAALDIGECAVTDLAQRVKMPRTSVQGIIQQMQTKGLMNCYLKRKRKIWVAENPEKLQILLKEREAALKSIMPELQAKRFSHGGRPMIRVYSGAEQIKLIMQNILEAQRNISAIIDWDDWSEMMGKDFMDDFIEQRVKHFLKIRLIAPRTTLSQSLKNKDADESRQTRFLPEGATIKTSNFVYGNTLAIISLNKRQPVGVVMEDSDIAQTAGILFESLWSQCLKS